MSHRYDILIVGGGIVGLTAALAMGQRHYRVALIDTGSLTVDDRPMQRVYAINHASRHLLTTLGAWELLDSTRISHYEKMHVWDGVNGASIDFDSRMIAAPDLGNIIEESVLKSALLEKLSKEPTVQTFPDSVVTVSSICPDHMTLKSEHHTWEGQLLMVADGANSSMRNELQVALTTWPYHQNAIVTTVETEKSHQNTAYQVFNPDGPLAFLPLKNPHQSSIVWSTEPKKAQDLMALEPQAFNSELMNACSKHLGETRVLGNRHQFPLHMRHVKNYVGERWLLLGDAAHTIHPLAGLGLNVGLADISGWLRCLDGTPGSLASKKILGAYQRDRKSEVWRIIMVMEGFKRLFGQSLEPISMIRGLGLTLCNKMTPFKRLFIEHASG